jgi:ABC-type transport system involved in multi-copper enzyme maturation permease subunit
MVSSILFGVVALVVQVVAAVPWLIAVLLKPEDRRSLVRQLSNKQTLSNIGVGLGILVALALLVVFVGPSREAMENGGVLYGALLQLSLIADCFVFFFLLLILVWPKGGAVALAAFREGVRQSMFWLLVLFALLLMSVSPVIPYFTFGEDHIMVKELGYDTIMLAAVVFGALAASLFISEEIEGRTAVTLMSKPVSRRQFLLGKFIGILLAAGVLFGLLGTYFEGVQLFKHWWDKLDPVPDPAWVLATIEQWGLEGSSAALFRGLARWLTLGSDTFPGLILSFSQVMILVAISVALATRVPMVVNLTLVLVVYFLSHLTPILVDIGKEAQTKDAGSAVAQLLTFTAQLMNSILPDLNAFHIDPSLMSDTPLPTGPFLLYVGSVTFYGILYTLAILFFGLILFEDRDLA